MLKFNIFTLFPELHPGPFSFSIMQEAISNNLFNINAIDIKNYAIGKHKLIDDKIYGGGSGMLMRPDVISESLERNNINKGSKILCMSAKGKLFNQSTAKELSTLNEISIICPRYEGIDQRFIEEYDVEEYSIGNYVLSNGDISSYIVMDSIVRNIDGVLGSFDSLKDESFSLDVSDLVEYDQYTKPAIWKDRKVPEILKSGHHAQISQWKDDSSKRNTQINRPDLYSKLNNKKQYD